MIIYRYFPNAPKVLLDRYKEVACYEFALAWNWSATKDNQEIWLKSAGTSGQESLKKAVELFGLKEDPTGPFKFYAYFSEPTAVFDHIWVEYGDWVYDTTPGNPIHRMRKAGKNSKLGPSYALTTEKKKDDKKFKEYKEECIVGPVCVTALWPALAAILNDPTLSHWIPECNVEE